MKLEIFTLIMAGLTFSACSHTGTPAQQGADLQVTPEQADNTSFTVGEIELHNSRDNCWMVIGDKVYNVTPYIADHPGGDSILVGCGTDATELFETKPGGNSEGHSEGARRILEQYYIGNFGN